MAIQKARNVFLATAGAIFLSVSPATALPQFSPGCMIQSSPFYQRLLGAGVFDIVQVQPASRKPAQLLFRIARGLQYSPDRSKADVWQNADETTRNYGGDCEDKAIWLYTQMRRNGYRDVALHIGKYAPSSVKFHVWVTYVDDADRTILMDPTIQIKPWDVMRFPEKDYRSCHILTGDDCISL